MKEKRTMTIKLEIWLS